MVIRIELDSYTHTDVTGFNCCVLTYTGRECDVSPYGSEYTSVRGVPKYVVATSWQLLYIAQLYILIMNKE